MKKIAIKYSEENWPEIKKAVDLLRENGIMVDKRKCVMALDRSLYLENHLSQDRFDYIEVEPDSDSLILTMPQDMPKLKAALGVVEYKEYIEPSQFKKTIKNNGGVVFMIDFSDNKESKIKGYLKKFPESFKLSTKEAYEAQEADKKGNKIGELYYKLHIDTSQVTEAMRKLKDAGNSLIIKTLKAEIDELNSEIEAKDKRIAELEGNLIILGDLISKTLS